MKPLASFVGSLHALHGPQDGYDIVPPQGEGVTVYNEAYFATANAETARKRREGGPAGQRRGRGRGDRNERIEIDPTEFLQMLEDVLAFDMEPQRRDNVLRALQDGPGATVVTQLEVSVWGIILEEPRLIFFSALGSSAPRFCGAISQRQSIPVTTGRPTTSSRSRWSKSSEFTTQ